MGKKEWLSRPWINEDGTKKTDGEISRLGQKWDQKTWKYFLNEDLGTLRGYSSCILVPHICKSRAANNERSLWERDDGKYSQKFRGVDLKSVFEVAFLELSPREEAILREFFWNERRSSDVARCFCMLPSSIRRTRKRILEKLRLILTSEDFKEKLLFYKNNKSDIAS